MTKQQIASAYIEAAEKAIRESSKYNDEEFTHYLSDEDIYYGICHFIYSKFYVDIYNYDFMNNTKWPYQPGLTLKDINIERLQHRINILKTWL